jgi:uncharacterized protein with von Willebrand factor type A (vWA) domain
MVEDEKYTELKSYMGRGLETHKRNIWSEPTKTTHWDYNVLVYRQEYAMTYTSTV